MVGCDVVSYARVFSNSISGQNYKLGSNFCLTWRRGDNSLMYQRSNRVCGFSLVTGWSGWVLIGLSMTVEHEQEVGLHKDLRLHKMWGTHSKSVKI